MNSTFSRQLISRTVRTLTVAKRMASSSSSSNVPAHVRQDGKLSAVYEAMNKIAPLSMADTSWDNVGIQLQAPLPEQNTGQTILLCNDLTTSVTDEVIGRKDVAVIVTYHPIIFRGLKSFTLDNSQQRSLLRLAAANVSIYASHTSIDACEGGNADWLAKIVSGQQKATVKPIESLKESYKGHDNAGMGRLVQLSEPTSIDQLVKRVKEGTGLKHVIVGIPLNVNAKENTFSTIAVAAGSAGSIVSRSNAQVWVTGELSHHEALAAVEKGIVVILTLHGNSERAYLRQVLQEKLQQALDKMGGERLNVVVSEADREPLEIM